MLIEQALNGLTLGLLYALIALGYTLVYGILELINFAHGEVMMFGAFYAYVFMEPLTSDQALGMGVFSAIISAVPFYDRVAIRAGRLIGAVTAVAAAVIFGSGAYQGALGALPFLLAILLALPYSALLALSLERIAYRPLRNQDRLIPLISAIGASLFLQNLAQMKPWFFGTLRKRYVVPEWLQAPAFSLEGVEISNLRVVIFATAIVMMAGVWLFINRTRMGTAMRATAQNRKAAALMGIDTDGVIALTFALGAVLAAVAGVLYGLYLGSIYPFMGYMAGVKAFTAAVLGGIGSVPGAMVGGIVLGLLESLGSIEYPELKDAIAFTVLIIVLLVRPSGLMGVKRTEKV